jgi:alkanesulfonate monooxygenase SsuD/methylene tetrahydromethanopterin reductase-like flavin-dependent oxidoreductase (luciferase family)
MGAAGAACTWVVLPFLGAVSDSAKLAAAGGDPAVVAAAEGEQLQQILAAAAEASFRTIAIIPLVLIFVFTAIAVADRMRKKN